MLKAHEQDRECELKETVDASFPLCLHEGQQSNL